MLVGVASWTDPTITKGEVFYPKGADSAEARLRYYSSRFPLVEVDSTYYALPARRTADLWAERTPDDFTFNVKAFALMTGQPTEVSRLPKPLRDALPKQLTEKKRIYATDLDPELYDAVWAVFLDAMEPLRASGKLGAVLLQYPRWFLPNRESDEAILDAVRRLSPLRGAVEFRNARWFTPQRAERTLEFLASHDIPFVAVDEPQGMESSVPPVFAVTSPALAMVRLHGRRSAMWEARGITAVERFRYLYDKEELAARVPAIEKMTAAAGRTHVVFNNCYGNYGTTNAIEMGKMLAEQA
ncbi:MAG: DUF72 domain-containing protein [Gemmatimonadota bacterium]|nr:DUF72 domain-containing protein [Gemmatimonadota bacterium]